jgi:hypothetical protein
MLSLLHGQRLAIGFPRGRRRDEYQLPAASASPKFLSAPA